MGIVLKGWDASLRRIVAIKVLAPHLATSSAARRRFVREAHAAAAVAHEHVVPIFAVAAGHDPPFLVMQFVEGRTLQQRLDADGPTGVRETLRIGLQAAHGLAAAHRQGIIHRDIKPANILLENGVERVRITDFGLARAVDDASLTQSGVVAGTPLFMAPEQAEGRALDHRADLFSLGSVLYAMCTGRPPFRSSTLMGVIRRVCDEQPRPIRELNPDIPDWLCGIIGKLLAKRPDDRFASATEVADLLTGCLAHMQHPLTVPLPAAASALMMTMTSMATGVAPSIQPAAAPARDPKASADSRSGQSASRSEPLVSLPRVQIDSGEAATYARRALRWPARLLTATAVVNGLVIFMLLLPLLSYSSLGRETPAGLGLTLIVLLLFVGNGSIFYGAIRMSTLGSYRWAVASAVLSLLTGPAYPIGWVAGIWSLVVLGNDRVRTAFAVGDHSRTGDSADPASILPSMPGQIVARSLAIMIIAVTGIAGPCVLWSMSAYRAPAGQPQPDLIPPVLLLLPAVAIVIGRLVRYGYQIHSSQTPSVQPATWKAAVLSPSGWISTIVTVAALILMVIQVDFSEARYFPDLELAAIFATLAAAATLIGIILVRVFRRRSMARRGELPSDGAGHSLVFGWPVFLLAILIPAGMAWSSWLNGQGYVHFDIDSSDALLRLRREGSGWGGSLHGPNHAIRVRPGRYEWSVTEYGLMKDTIERGEVAVAAGTGQTVAVRILGDHMGDRLRGRWTVADCRIDWKNDGLIPDYPVFFPGTADGQTDRGDLPDWTRQPEWVELTGDRAIFHYAQEPRTAIYGLTVDSSRDMKTLLLTVDPESDRTRSVSDVVSGIWAVGEQSLVIRLEPASRGRPLRFHSTRTLPTQVELTFSRPDDRTLLQGDWSLIGIEQNGTPFSAEQLEGRILTFDRESARFGRADQAETASPWDGGMATAWTSTVDLGTALTPGGETEPVARPRGNRFVPESALPVPAADSPPGGRRMLLAAAGPNGTPLFCLYRIEGDRLTLVISPENYPASPGTPESPPAERLTFERVRAGASAPGSAPVPAGAMSDLPLDPPNPPAWTPDPEPRSYSRLDLTPGTPRYVVPSESFTQLVQITGKVTRLGVDDPGDGKVEIDIGLTQHLAIGRTLDVTRKHNGDHIHVGRLQVLSVAQDSAVAAVVSVAGGQKIAVGDQVSVVVVWKTLAPADSRIPSSPQDQRRPLPIPLPNGGFLWLLDSTQATE